MTFRKLNTHNNRVERRESLRLRICLLDTNVISVVSVSADSAEYLCGWARTAGLVLAVAPQQMIELTRATRKREVVASFLSTASVKVLEPDLLEAEVACFPSSLTPADVALSVVPTKDDWRTFLSRDDAFSVALKQSQSGSAMHKRHLEIMDNFPPAPSGRYTLDQGPEFAWMRSTQSLGLAGDARLLNFLKQNRNAFLNHSVLPSLDVVGWVIFGKYYVGKRVPAKNSDLGDLLFTQYLPYVDVLVTEADLAATIRSLQSRCGSLLPRFTFTLRDVTQRNLDTEISS